jgi:hypothetical protein
MGKKRLDCGATKWCANGPETGPAPQILWFNPLSVLENAIAASYAGAVNQLHPTAGTFQRSFCFSRRMPFSYVSLHRAQLDSNQAG